ncbi:hypothetical protein KAU34_01465 [candidate division WOR-3 bacterium]|nr:hypothetical protein [candidate division WOR-3 bacterium]
MFEERKGIALVISLIILLLLTLIGASIMMVSINEERTVSVKLDHITSLAYAEAGVSEAVRRLSIDPSNLLYIGDTHYPYNPDWTVYILLNDNPQENEPPIYYTSSVQMSFPDSQRLCYTTENVDSLYSLVIHHKINSNDTREIIYYNWEKMKEESYNPETYTGKFFPVEVIEVTGVVGTTRKRGTVEVARKSSRTYAAAAFSCNWDVEIRGKIICCGHNHVFTTPWGTDAGAEHFDCFDDPYETDDPIWHVTRNDMQPHGDRKNQYKKPSVDLKCSDAGCLPGISAPEHKITIGRSSDVRGNPDWANDSTTASFFYLYQMLGASDWNELEELFPWQSIVPGNLDGGSYTGLYKCDGDLYLSGVINFTGVLWVTGKIKQTGHFYARGIVYSQENIRFDGNVWILGAVTIEGSGHKTIKPFNGSGVLLYSSDEIERAIAQAQGYRVISRK